MDVWGELERLWGKNRFLKFYFYTGIGAGLITMVLILILLSQLLELVVLYMVFCWDMV